MLTKISLALSKKILHKFIELRFGLTMNWLEDLVIKPIEEHQKYERTLNGTETPGEKS